MAFGFIKSNQGSQGSNTSFTLNIQTVPVGTLVVVNAKFAGSVSAVSVTDNASVPNTYAQVGSVVGTGTNYITQFYGVALTGGATSITVSWTTATSIRATVDQFSGGQQSNAAVFDVAATNNGTGTSSSVTLSPTNSGELVVAGIGMTSGTSAITIGANYVAGTNNNSNTTQYRTVSTTSETAPLSWTGSTAWAEVAGAYIPLPGSTNFLQFF